MVVKESAQDYIEAIYIVEKEKGIAYSIDVARQLNVSKPSVSYAIKNLSQAGYLYMDEDNSKRIVLTKKGRALAEQMYERHVFFTNWLKELGVDGKIATRDACRIEHVISKESFHAIREYVKNRHEHN